MSSQRHTLLDAAHACVMDVGLRRTTLADVAQKAGVSKVTASYVLNGHAASARISAS